MMAKKRANGEGSIRKRKDGRWEGRYTAGHDPATGKTIYKNVLGKTQGEVKEKLKKAIADSQQLDVTRATTYTVRTWIKLWYEVYAEPRLREKTKDYYLNYINNHIIPQLGDIKLDKLTTIQIQKFYNDLQKNGRIQRYKHIELKEKGLSVRVVHLKESGPTAELAEKLNQTSRHLQKQNELIARRDMTRANWIAGVSHDIRTPLALIMGYGEQLAQQFPQSSEPRKKADAICTQSKKIKALIEDLNLTFKLQYNAQPLRRTPIQMGAWLRRCVADFCDSLGQTHSLDLTIREPAGQTTLEADGELLTRTLDNLLNNSVRHNPSGCEIQVMAELEDGQFVLTVRDNGAGYPEAVLQNLSDTCSDPNAPHILGMHLVGQIVAAHGGEVSFRNDSGAVAVLQLPIVP